MNGDTLWTQVGTSNPVNAYAHFLPATDGTWITSTDSAVIIIDERANYARLPNPAVRLGRHVVHMHDVIRSAHGGYLSAGTYTPVQTSFLSVARFDDDGALLWNLPRDSADTQYDSGPPRLIETADGGFVVAGHTQGYPGGNHQIWLVKFASQK